MKVYTFWEPRENMPYYIQLCMKTWEKFLPNAEIILLDYKNIGEYIDVNEIGEMLFSGRFSLRQISDALRVLLLARRGGVWLDTDTIVLSSNVEKYLLPDEKNRTIFFGNAKTRAPHIAFINTPPGAECMNAWLAFIKEKLKALTPETEIDSLFLSNSFINEFSKEHIDEIEVLDRVPIMPELKIIPKSEEWSLQNRMQAHQNYYHLQNLHLADVDADMLMLHNSWVPGAFRNYSLEDFLRCDCTLTNVLAEALDMKLPPPEERFRLLQKENKKWIKIFNTPPPPKKFRLVVRKDKSITALSPTEELSQPVQTEAEKLPEVPNMPLSEELSQPVQTEAEKLPEVPNMPLSEEFFQPVQTEAKKLPEVPNMPPSPKKFRLVTRKNRK